jgi:acyl carrier protein
MTTGSLPEQLSSRVEEIIRQHVESAKPLELATSLQNDLNIDSLELVELSVKMEKTFAIKIPFADLRPCDTVEEVIQLVERIMSKRLVKGI